MFRGVRWAVVVGLSSMPALADPAAKAEAEPVAEDPRVVQARELFRLGVDRVKAAEWANALVAFERSESLRPHATTTFNVGACERAMGSYTRARATFLRALREDQERPGELAQSLHDEALGFIGEVDRLVAQVDVVVEPVDAAIAVDGRPLAVEAAAGSATAVAGLEPPGPGRPLPFGRALLIANPGAHVITLSRKGFSDVVVNRSFASGARTALNLRLDLLPATLDVASDVPGAIVNVDGKDFGPVPVTLLRPPGAYRVVVEKAGFEPYEAHVAVQAGERAALRATLSPEKHPLTKQWWFWASAASVLAGGVLATYYLTRPTEPPPPYDGGTTGWVVHPTAAAVR